MPKIKANNNHILKLDGNIIVCLFFVIVILALYWPLSHYDFVKYDDNLYIYENPQVSSGLTGEGIFWSFQTTYSCNWHPLTWLSHMLDAELYGLDAGGHHLTNVLFHIANTVLLFILLKAMTGAVWRSAFVAALFALHPLHVESVAWVSERKDLLSTFLGILTLISYAQYTQQRRRSWYGLALLFFILGLMAKPMLVTLPFLLLLLDYWPLGRLNMSKGFRLQPVGGVSSVYPLILEKLPFFVLTTASCVVTYYAQQSAGAMVPFEVYPLDLRVANAIVAYAAYIGKMFWPVNLTVFYQLSDSFTFWKIVAASALLLSVSFGVLVQIRKQPYLAVGWFWYVGTLVPVIGLVQVGGQAMADRYTYIPLIGLFIIIAWGSADSFRGWRYKRIFLSCTAGMAIIALVFLTNSQIRHWANSVALYEHAVKTTGGTWVAHNNFANALNDAGRTDEAIRHFKIALHKNPPEPEGIYNNMAHVLASASRNREAIEHYSEALRINPNSARIHVNFGSALLAQGKIDEAVDHFDHALKLDPDFANAYNNLGLAHMRRGHIEDAVYYFRVAHQKNPSHENAHQNLNLAIAIHERIIRAVYRMRQSLNIDPAESGLDLKIVELSDRKRDLIETVNNFQKSLEKQPGFIRIDENNISAVSTVMEEYENTLPLFLKINKIQPTSADTSYHIACLYYRKGMVEESIKWLDKAFAEDPSRRDFFLADPDLENLNQSPLKF